MLSKRVKWFYYNNFLVPLARLVPLAHLVGAARSSGAACSSGVACSSDAACSLVCRMRHITSYAVAHWQTRLEELWRMAAMRKVRT